MNKRAVSEYDRGLLYGDGIFETMRSYDGAIFRLEEHLDRLFGSADMVKIKMPLSKKELKRNIYAAIRKRRLKDASVRITVTRGEGSFRLSDECKKFDPTLIITARPFKGYPSRYYSCGITVDISAIRQNEFSPLSKIKSLSFLNYILGRMSARERGFDEAIFLNTNGYVAEAATSNIFAVKGKRIFTPSIDSGVIPGITRSCIIKIAQNIGMKVRERKIRAKELVSSDELFLTNSIAEVLPVVRVGRSRIGKGVPGKVTKLLHSCYRKML